MFGMVGLRNCGWIRASTCHRAWTAKRWNPELGGKATVARLRPGLTGAFVGYWGCMHSGQKVQARCGGCTPARAATLMQGKRAGEKYIGCSIAPLSDRPKGQWQRRRLAWGRVGQWLAGTGAGTGGGGPCRGRGARPAAAAEAAPAASPAAAAEAPWLAAGEERGAPGWGRTGRTRQGPRRSHLLAVEPVSPGAGVWLRTRGLRTGRGPGALSASSPPQPPLGSALPPGGRPGASCGAGAPGLHGGGKCSGVCACSGDKSCGQDPTAGALEGWWWRRRGAGRAGAACRRGTKMCRRYRRSEPPPPPRPGFPPSQGSGEWDPSPPRPVHPQVGSRSSPGVPGDIWKAWR